MFLDLEILKLMILGITFYSNFYALL